MSGFGGFGMGSSDPFALHRKMMEEHDMMFQQAFGRTTGITSNVGRSNMGSANIVQQNRNGNASTSSVRISEVGTGENTGSSSRGAYRVEEPDDVHSNYTSSQIPITRGPNSDVRNESLRSRSFNSMSLARMDDDFFSGFGMPSMSTVGSDPFGGFGRIVGSSEFGSFPSNSGARVQSSFQSYSYSSNGVDPPQIRASSQVSKTINGVTEIQRKEKDNNKEVIKVQRVVGDRSRIVEQEKINGVANTVETLINLQDHEKESFDRDFKSRMPVNQRAKLSSQKDSFTTSSLGRLK